MSTFTGAEQPEQKIEDEPLSPELAALAADTPSEDSAPTKGTRRKRSGTSGAERARRAKAGASSTPTPARPRTSRAAKGPDIAAGMAQLYTMVGVGVSMVPSGASPVPAFAGQSVTGVVGRQLIAESASIGEAWEKAAKDDARIRDALEKLLAVSTIGQVVTAHLPVVLYGLAAAGMVPAALIGIPDPTAPPAAPAAA